MTRLYFCIFMLVLAQNVHSLVIESADSSSGDFSVVHSDQWFGAKFEVTGSANVSTLGVLTSHLNGSGFTGFLSIVQLDSYSLLPDEQTDPFKLSGQSGLLFSDGIDIPYTDSPSDTFVSLDLNLTEGFYGVVLGSEDYNNIRLMGGEAVSSPPSYFVLDTQNNWRDIPSQGFASGYFPRFIIEGEGDFDWVYHSANSVPTAIFEPDSILLLTICIIGLLKRKTPSFPFLMHSKGNKDA